MFANKLWQGTLGAIALLSFSSLIAPAQASPETTKDNLVAQAGTASLCRRVNAEFGLNIREEPSLNSRVIGTLADGARVYIEDLGAIGWVSINEPRDGFISAEYLTYCTAEGPPVTDQCAQVNAYPGLNVRQRPTIQSSIVTTLENGRYVNLGELDTADEDWVQIMTPVRGFVAAEYLTQCP